MAGVQGRQVVSNEVEFNFEKFVLVNQTKRAMLSVILQIAEGSNRKTEKDKNLFINRALTSLDEVVACLDCALDDKYITSQIHEPCLSDIENLAKQLRGFSKYISNSY
ncbi:MAG: four helix bundle protein [bacterium]|nr:four helix bundle protein [bacterium]